MQVSRGTVYMRAGTWTIGYTVGGRRVREAIGANRQLAEAVLKKRIVEAIEDRHFDKRNTGRIPFSEFAETYLDRCIAVLKSVKTERIRVLFWKRFFGSRPIGQITTVELQDWQAQKRATNKPTTVNLMMGRLRHMFNRAIEWDLLDETPFRRIKFLRPNNARLRYLSIEECRRLLDGCGVDHMRGIITVAVHTGMRLGEILNLKHADLDFVSGVLTVRNSKNGESRPIPMDSTVTTLFKRTPKQSNSDYVFPSPTGERWACNQKAFRHARARAGLVDPTSMTCGIVFIAMDDEWGRSVRLEGNPGAQEHCDDPAVCAPVPRIPTSHGGSHGSDLGQARTYPHREGRTVAKSVSSSTRPAAAVTSRLINSQ